MKIKQISIFTLLAIFFLSSCSRVPEEKKIAIKVLYNNIAEAPFKKDWLILKQYSKLKNIDLDIILADNEEYLSYIDQALNAKESPDIILNCWPETVEKYASQGLLLPISDYIDLMPYFQEYIKKNNLKADIEKLQLTDGKQYILPGFQRPIQVQQWIYRKDLFEKYKLPIPETYDELYEDLVILKRIYPESKPISACWGGDHLFAMMGAGYDISAGWAGIKNYDEKNDTWFYTYTSDNYKKMLQYLHKCYKAGLLDAELFTQSNNEYVTKLSNGLTFVSVGWITSGFEYLNGMLEQNGNTGGTWYPLPVPESTYGIRKLPSVPVFRKGLAISNSLIENDDFTKIIEFIDWAVYSDEGIELTYWGVEGTTFKHTSHGNVLLAKNVATDITLKSAYGFNMFFNLNESASYEDYKKPEYIVNFLNKSMNAGEIQKEMPVLKLADNEIMIMDSVTDALDSIAKEYREKFIYGELNFADDWIDYVGLLNDNGSQVIETVWNDAWQAQKGR